MSFYFLEIFNSDENVRILSVFGLYPGSPDYLLHLMFIIQGRALERF